MTDDTYPGDMRHPRRKQKGTFKSVCDLCGEPIYRAYDHTEGCIY